MNEKTSLLLVDDHRMFADALALLLEGQEGIGSVEIASTAEEGLSIMEQRGCPTVVLMDIDLPGMDGIEATARALSICPSSQIVVITALQPSEVIARAIEAGACGFIPKTRAADELVDVIRRAAAGEMVLPTGDLDEVLRRIQRVVRSGTGPDLSGRLTAREIDILQSLAQGKSTDEVAQTLSISRHTVHSHVRSILAKLSVRSKLEAVLAALRSGLIRLE